MENSEDQAKQKKKLIKRLAIIAFILLNIGIIAWTAFSEFGNSEKAADLSEVKIEWWLLIPAALMFAIAAAAETYKYYVLMRRTKSAPDGASKRQIWKVAKRTLLLGRYYDNLTPASVGGQPFQIYYMHKSGVKNGYDAVIPVIGMITDQIGFLIMATIALIIGTFTNQIWSPALIAVGWVGLLFFAFFPLIILAATFLPGVTNEIIRIVIALLGKLRIIKEPETSTEKAISHMKEYADGIKTILKERGLFPLAILLGALYYAGLMMIPFFVLSAFGSEVGLFACFATTIAVSSAIYFVPTPGNAGAAEGAFYSVFSVLPSAGHVFWAMLIWRFFVYYLWLILGGLTQLIMYLKDKSLLEGWSKGVKKLEKTAKTFAKNASENK